MDQKLYNEILNNDYKYGKNMVTINGQRYYIQCPSEINENTSFYVAGRGAGGIDNTKSTFDAAKDANVIIIAPVNEKSESFNGAYDVAKQFVDTCPTLSNVNMGFSGHSNSGNLAVQAARDYCERSGNTTVLVLNDPFGTGETASNMLPTSYDYTPLKGSTIIDITSNGTNSFNVYKNTLTKAAGAGAEVLIVEYDNANHGDADDIAATIGTYDINDLQLTDGKITYIDHYGVQRTANLNYKLLDENGNIKTISADEAQLFIDNAVVKDTKNGNIKNTSGEEELRDFAKSYGAKDGEDTLASNLCFVSQCVDNMSNMPNVDPLSGPSDGITGSFFATDNYFIGICN